MKLYDKYRRNILLIVVSIDGNLIKLCSEITLDDRVEGKPRNQIEANFHSHRVFLVSSDLCAINA